MPSHRESILSVATAISAGYHLMAEAAATAALEEKVRDSTICIRPIYDPLATEFRFKEGRPFGIELFTTHKDTNEISTHLAQSGLYSAHTLSKALSDIMREEIEDDIRRLSGEVSTDARKTDESKSRVDLLEAWTTNLKSHLDLCGEPAKDITLITEQESKRLLTLKRGGWYKPTEPGNTAGAF